MNQAARRLGKTLACILPVVLVLSGTLAVTRVPWAPSGSEAQLLTAASSGDAHTSASSAETARSTAPHEALRQRLVRRLWAEDPGVALTGLQQAITRDPSLGGHCASIARSLGRAAVAKYGSAHRAQRWSRPVCDTSFASGVLTAGTATSR